jgi:hypothetical protein
MLLTGHKTAMFKQYRIGDPGTLPGRKKALAALRARVRSRDPGKAPRGRLCAGCRRPAYRGAEAALRIGGEWSPRAAAQGASRPSPDLTAP